MHADQTLGPYADIVLGAMRRLCGELEPDLEASLLGTGTTRKLGVGEVLYRHGEPGSSMHIVISGRLQVAVPTHDGSTRVVAYPQPGDAVGEMALLSGAPRAATVIAVRDTLLAEIEKSQLDALIAARPEVFGHVARVIIERFTGLQGRIARRDGARSFMVLPIHVGAPTARFASHLRSALLRIGSVLHLTEESASQHFQFGDLRDYGRYIDECEATHDHVILETNGSPSQWLKVCLGYADTIVLVADATSAPAPTAIESWLAAESTFQNTHARIELVLIHPRTATPSGTGEWLRERKVARHHHVREENVDDVLRVARFLCGRALALVLSGGGARGFAHMGVIRALQEAGVPIDAVGGASFGALVATGPARQMTHESIFAEQRLVFADGDPLGDYTIPVVSLVRGRHLEEILCAHLPHQIEDLFVPFFAVSSDISANEIKVHDRGPLWKAVRASISLPAVLPPALEDGHLLVDGGVMNNLPVDVMRDRMRGPIIAADLGTQTTASSTLDRVPTSIEYLKTRLLPRQTNVDAPTLSRVILQVTTLASRKEIFRARSLADLYLNLPTAPYDFLDWSRMRELEQVGYECARPRLNEWLQRNPANSPLGQCLRDWQWHRSHGEA